MNVPSHTNSCLDCSHTCDQIPVPEHRVACTFLKCRHGSATHGSTSAARGPRASSVAGLTVAFCAVAEISENPVRLPSAGRVPFARFTRKEFSLSRRPLLTFGKITRCCGSSPISKYDRHLAHCPRFLRSAVVLALGLNACTRQAGPTHQFRRHRRYSLIGRCSGVL